MEASNIRLAWIEKARVLCARKVSFTAMGHVNHVVMGVLSALTKILVYGVMVIKIRGGLMLMIGV